jgi:hypothetical protein
MKQEMVGCAYCGRVLLRLMHADHAYRCGERRRVVEQREREAWEREVRERERGDNEH